MNYFTKIVLSFLAISLDHNYQTKAFSPSPNFYTSTTSRATSLFAHEKISSIIEGEDRRSFLLSSLSKVTAVASIVTSPSIAGAADTTLPKILVLGGTGLVGTEVCSQLASRGIPYAATSRDGRDNTVKFNAIETSDIRNEVKNLARGCGAVISTIGSINTDFDYQVNAASGQAALGAKDAGVKRFVYISVAPEVRESVKGLSFLEDYMKGKVESESSITQAFSSPDDSYTIIQPTFIYGSEKFGLNPPRVTKGYGSIIEGLLSTPPFRALASVAPGIVGVAFEPPVSAEDVAKAAVVGAFAPSSLVLDTHDKIVEVAKVADA